MTKDKLISPHAGHPDFGKSEVFSGLVIVLLPFVLLAINDNWIFDAIGYIDPWIYAGFHLHLPKFLEIFIFGNSYYASRVPWTVTGWVLHLAFNDAVANYILHFAVFYLATFSLYVAIRTIFANPSAGWVAAFLLGTSSYFLLAVGWNYVDGPSIACSLAGIAALASAAVQPRWRLATLLWGFAACTMVSMYISLVLFVPIQIAMFLFLNRLREKRPVLMVAALFAAGGLSGMLFWGLVNWLLGGPFLYFMGQINALTSVVHDRSAYAQPLAQWVWSSPWLLVPAITFVFSCAYVALHAKSAFKKMQSNDAGPDLEASLFVCCLVDIAASLVFIVLDLNHFPMLEVDYEASALLPFVYLSIGGALAAMIKPSKRGFWLILTAVAVITLTPWVLATYGYIFPKWEWFKGPTYVIGWILAASLVLLFSTQRFSIQKSYRFVGAVLVVLLLSIVNLGAPATQLSYPPKSINKPQTLALFEASRAIGPFYPPDRARFWYNAKSRDGSLFQSIASTYLFGYSLVSQYFPKLTTEDGRLSTFEPEDRIFLLTSGEDDPIPLADATVADQHFVFKQVAKIPVRRSGVTFTIFVTDVKLDRSKYEEIASPQAFTKKLPSKIVTPAVPWFRMSTLPFSDPVTKQASAGYVRVRLRVDRGQMAAGVLKKNDNEHWIILRTFTASPDVRDIYLRIPNFSEAGPLVILNGINPRPSAGSVEAASVLWPLARLNSGVN